MVRPITCSLWFFLGAATLSHGADVTKLRTLTGKSYEGDLVGISDKEIVFRGTDGPVNVPLKEVLDIDLATAAAPTDKYIDIEVTDGSLLHCSHFLLKKNQVEAKLVGGLEIKIPLASISYILNEAQDAKIREEWQTALSKRGNSDLLAIKDPGGTVNHLDGTFGEGDEKGENIEFETTSGTKRTPSLARIRGMSFLRKTSTEKPETICKIHDTSKNLWYAAQVAFNDKGFQVTTVAGVKLELPRQAAARLDFSQGRLTYLSDLEPVKLIERSNVERVERYHRDKNLDDGPLRIAKETYSKGLAIHAYTELMYDIGGQYKDFKAVLGVDPTVGGESRVKVLIEGDGRQLFSEDFDRKTGPRPLTLDVKNIKQLRIVVASKGLLDLGDHVNIADAKVSK
jgi:hypothetical protein